MLQSIFGKPSNKTVETERFFRIINQDVPLNDGGISLGQAAIAATIVTGDL